MSLSLKSRYSRWLLKLLVLFLLMLTAVSAIYQVYEVVSDQSKDIGDEITEVVVVLVAGIVALPLMMIYIGKLCSRMLAPLQDIRETAERINAGRLDERIKTDNPEDDLGKLAGVLNNAFDRYHDAIERLQRFSSDASHQLRTPLTSIRTTGEVCLQKNRNVAEYRETIGSMLEDAQRLSDMVEKLLMLARIGADKVRSSFTAVDLGRQVREIVERNEILSAGKSLRVHLRAPDGCIILGDSEILQQLIANLFDNAIIHTPECGEIFLDVTGDSNGKVSLTIRDTGPGIPAELRESLFTRFNRGPAVDTAGFGLGLAIVADIAQIHGGTVKLLDETGAAFRVSFPRHVPAAV